MDKQDKSKRQVAHKIRVADILNNRYVKAEGWLPNYIAVGEIKVSRANIIGVIVSKSTQENDENSHNFILDDGTGRIPLRFFEHGKDIEVSDIVNVIGRPREFGSDRYIVPEILKKVTDSRWIEIRKMELALKKHDTQPKVELSSHTTTEVEELSEDENPSTKIISIIKKLDSGAGADFQEISVKFITGNPEEYIKKLLEQGDIFEVKPGRYKVLE